MKKRVTEIVVKFRRPPVWMFTPLGSPDVHRNTLRLTIQPDEGFALYFHVKAPGKPLKLERLPLDFFYKERFRGAARGVSDAAARRHRRRSDAVRARG